MTNSKIIAKPHKNWTWTRNKSIKIVMKFNLREHIIHEAYYVKRPKQFSDFSKFTLESWLTRSKVIKSAD